jgi:alkylation response protein AidB-like acyl-CoA dehydrogenase
VSLSALLVGAMREAVKFAFGYAKTRVSFGKPLVGHQAMALRLANMLVQMEASKLLLWQTAWSPNARDGVGVQVLIDQVVEASREIFREAVQVCGGHGYVDGLPPHAWFQHASALTALLREIALLAEGA